MALVRVGARCLARVHPVTDVTPVIGVDLGGVDPEGFDGIDMAKDVLDLGPALDPEQDFAARSHEGERLIRAAGRNGAQDVDARDDRAVVVGRPADEAEYRIGSERNDATGAVEDLRFRPRGRT